MDRNITGKRPHFRPVRKKSNFYRVMLYLSLILAGVWVLLSYERGQIQAPFQPTPTPTRLPESYILQAEAYFRAGKLDDPSNQAGGIAAVLPAGTAVGPEAEQATPTPVPAVNDAIEAYQAALAADPQNHQAWAELARIQAYSSSLLPSDAVRLQRLKEALNSANRAVELAPDDSQVHAIRAFVLDWYAGNSLVPSEEREALLVEANGEANRAYQLDFNNALALAYYAEILVDQQQWSQAEKYAERAVQEDPNSMDTHRVYGYVMESMGFYSQAIEQYKAAAEITPNLTFLYIFIGRLYRDGLWRGSEINKVHADMALEYFAMATDINKSMGVQDPLPYIEIARTYTQLGQFFAAARNAEKALEFNATEPHTYGQLGQIFIRARNYEGAMPLLKCAVRGCTAEENEMGQAEVKGLPLTSKRVAYYYLEYGNVLAFLSRPRENYCTEAIDVLRDVRDTYPDDPIMMAIADESETICRNINSGG